MSIIWRYFVEISVSLLLSLLLLTFCDFRNAMLSRFQTSIKRPSPNIHELLEINQRLWPNIKCIDAGPFRSITILLAIFLLFFCKISWQSLRVYLQWNMTRKLGLFSEWTIEPQRKRTIQLLFFFNLHFWTNLIIYSTRAAYTLLIHKLSKYFRIYRAVASPNRHRCWQLYSYIAYASYIYAINFCMS